MINVDVDRNPQATIGRTMYKSQLVTQRGKEQGKARVIKLEKSGAGRTLKMNNSWQYAKHVQVPTPTPGFEQRNQIAHYGSQKRGPSFHFAASAPPCREV